MSSRHLVLDRRLVALNVALLIVLGIVTFAGAQPGGTGAGPRGRGEYTMVSGRTQGSTTATIYILDAANQEVLALGWDRGNNKPDVVGHRSLADDAKYLSKPR